MMKVGIIQSSYIPWRGYFDIIDDVELFIYLDDVQYTRRDWRNRNKIKTPHGLIWLTVPVIFSRNDSNVSIENIKIDYSQRWIEKHIKSIKFFYSKSCFYSQLSEEFFNLLNRKFPTISELNIQVNEWIIDKLKIRTKVRKSSEFNPTGSKTDKLIDLLKKTNATVYLSGPKAKYYLEEEKFKKAGISLEYKVYEYLEYPQLFGKFEPNVSVLDLLFNCGKGSRDFLKSLKPNEKIL